MEAEYKGKLVRAEEELQELNEDRNRSKRLLEAFREGMSKYKYNNLQ